MRNSGGADVLRRKIAHGGVLLIAGRSHFGKLQRARLPKRVVSPCIVDFDSLLDRKAV